jgi:hypothetical protein
MGQGIRLIIITMEVDSESERWLLKVDVEQNVCIWEVLSVIERIESGQYLDGFKSIIEQRQEYYDDKDAGVVK